MLQSSPCRALIPSRPLSAINREKGCLSTRPSISSSNLFCGTWRCSCVRPKRLLTCGLQNPDAPPPRLRYHRSSLSTPQKPTSTALSSTFQRRMESRGSAAAVGPSSISSSRSPFQAEITAFSAPRKDQFEQNGSCNLQLTRKDRAFVAWLVVQLPVVRCGGEREMPVEAVCDLTATF